MKTPPRPPRPQNDYPSSDVPGNTSPCLRETSDSNKRCPATRRVAAAHKTATADKGSSCSTAPETGARNHSADSKAALRHAKNSRGGDKPAGNRRWRSRDEKKPPGRLSRLGKPRTPALQATPQNARARRTHPQALQLRAPLVSKTSRAIVSHPEANPRPNLPPESAECGMRSGECGM